MVNVNVKDSGMINCLTKVPTISPGKPSIGILSRRETMVVQAMVGMDWMGKIIGMLLGKEMRLFRISVQFWNNVIMKCGQRGSMREHVPLRKLPVSTCACMFIPQTIALIIMCKYYIFHYIFFI